METSRKHRNNVVDRAESVYSGSDEGSDESEDQYWRMPTNNNMKEVEKPTMIVHSVSSISS